MIYQCCHGLANTTWWATSW